MPGRRANWNEGCHSSWLSGDETATEMTTGRIRSNLELVSIATIAALACAVVAVNGATDSIEAAAGAADLFADKPLAGGESKPADEEREQAWNWHVQNTGIVQGYPGFSAKYSGSNSLPDGGEVRETISLDLFAGVRLWRGAEVHVDGLMWQGFGVGKTVGIEGFPNG